MVSGDLVGELAGRHEDEGARSVGPAAAPDSTRRATSGSANAIVLPLPVRPRPSTSRPARESGSVAVWIGNAVGDALRGEALDERRGHAELGEADRLGGLDVRRGHQRLGHRGVRRGRPSRLLRAGGGRGGAVGSSARASGTGGAGGALGGAGGHGHAEVPSGRQVVASTHRAAAGWRQGIAGEEHVRARASGRPWCIPRRGTAPGHCAGSSRSCAGVRIPRRWRIAAGSVPPVGRRRAHRIADFVPPPDHPWSDPGVAPRCRER